MSTKSRSAGADALSARHASRAPSTRSPGRSSPPIQTNPDLDTLAETLIRVAEAAQAREDRLLAAIDGAAAKGNLPLVRRLVRRLGWDPSPGHVPDPSDDPCG